MSLVRPKKVTQGFPRARKTAPLQSGLAPCFFFEIVGTYNTKKCDTKKAVTRLSLLLQRSPAHLPPGVPGAGGGVFSVEVVPMSSIDVPFASKPFVDCSYLSCTNFALN